MYDLIARDQEEAESTAVLVSSDVAALLAFADTVKNKGKKTLVLDLDETLIHCNP